MGIDDDIYPGGFYSIVRAFEKKQLSFVTPETALPDAEVDLMTLWKSTVCAPSSMALKCAEATDSARDEIGHKQAQLQHEFTGQNQVYFLHALLIAILRRSNPPSNAAILFHRIWREFGKEFVQDLPVRWQISAATTFADCGQTHDQRACGMGLSVLFDLIKLHDSERRLSGQPNDRPFKRERGTANQRLAFDMSPYSLRKGDMDRNMLARLWRLCEQDQTIAPLGFHMLRQVMRDQRSVFARLQQLKPADKTVDRLNWQSLIPNSELDK